MDEQEFEELTEEDRRAVNQMRELRKSPGWQFLSGELNETLEMLRDIYENDSIGSFDRLVGREFVRGQIAMLRLILELPEKVEEGSLAALKARQEQLKEAQEYGTDGSADQPEPGTG